MAHAQIGDMSNLSQLLDDGLIDLGNSMAKEIAPQGTGKYRLP
jgi:hypothetical protein